MNRRFDKLAGFTLISTAAVIWGSNGVVVNLIRADAFVIAFYRTLFATLALIPVAILAGRSRFLEAAREWRLLILNGLMNALGWGSLFYSMKLTPIAVSVLLNYLAPIFVAVLAPILLEERIRVSTVASLALSTIGVAVIFSDQMSGVGVNVLGVVYGLLSGLFYAIFIILSKKMRGGYPGYVIASYTYLSTLIFLSILVYAASQTIYVEWGDLPLLLLIGFANTAFAVTIYFHGLGLIEAQRAIILTYLEPLSAAVFGAIFLGQTPTIRLIAGGVMIVSSGYIVARY